jgi:hypothetical protein
MKRSWGMAEQMESAAGSEIDRPHPARVYDYFLGGKDNYLADRLAAEAVLEGYPDGRLGPQENRAFMGRAVEFLVREAGIRQFLDIGTGIPTSPNLHEVAQRIAPDTRVLYVDNDPVVLVHARALLASDPRGVTEYLNADLRDPWSILRSREFRRTLDLTQPVALCLIAVLHFLGHEDDPYRIVRELLAALPSGSYVVVTHATEDYNPQMAKMAATYRAQGMPASPRSRAEVTRFFEASEMEMVPPGLEVVHRWRPDEQSEDKRHLFGNERINWYGGVGRKP